MTVMLSTLTVYQANAEEHLCNKALNESSTLLCRGVAALKSNSNFTKRPRHMTTRELFFVFIKILFKCLDEDGVQTSLKSEAKRLVQECTQRNRTGTPGYEDLMESIHESLSTLLCDCYSWERSIRHLERYYKISPRFVGRRITSVSRRY